MKYIVLVISVAIVSCAPQASDVGYGPNPASASAPPSVPSGVHGVGFGDNGNAYEEQAVPPRVTYETAGSASGAHGIGYGPYGDIGDAKPANTPVIVASAYPSGGGGGAGFGPGGVIP